MPTINKNWHFSYCSHEKWNPISKTLPEAVICDVNFDGRTQFRKVGKWKHLVFKFQDSPVRCVKCRCNDGWSTCFPLCILASSALESLFIFILFLRDVYLMAYQQEYTLRRKPRNNDKLLKILSYIMLNYTTEMFHELFSSLYRINNFMKTITLIRLKQVYLQMAVWVWLPILNMLVIRITIAYITIVSSIIQSALAFFFI